MKTLTSICVLLTFALAISSAARAQTEGEPADKSAESGEGAGAEGEEFKAPDQPASPKKKSRFVTYMTKEMEEIGGMDLYGVTSQLPKGYLSVKWDWGTITAKSRYNKYGKLGPVMEPIAFTDDSGNEIVNIDLGLAGSGGGHTFQFSYGFLDPVDWYFELPFTYMDVSIRPKIADIKDEEGEVLKDEFGNPYRVHPNYAALLGVADPTRYDAGQFMCETLPLLGRPTPGTEYHANWLLGDINTGFSWNMFRNKRISGALTPRVFFPTGYVPDPNNNLMYGTGPELETGIGGWAIGATQGYDLRLFKHSYWVDIIFSTELGVAYAFKQERDYPTNFVTPSPMAQALDPEAFPDLTHLEGSFSYTPGWSLDWIAQLQLQVAILGLGVAYGVQYSQEPVLAADPAFVSMVEGLELFGPMAIQAVQVAASISLLPFYIPVDIAIQRRWVVGGYNAIVFDDYWQLTVKGYIPLKALWD